jgi:hypothetical protein
MRHDAKSGTASSDSSRSVGVGGAKFLNTRDRPSVSDTEITVFEKILLSVRDNNKVSDVADNMFVPKTFIDILASRKSLEVGLVSTRVPEYAQVLHTDNKSATLVAKPSNSAITPTATLSKTQLPASVS